MMKEFMDIKSRSNYEVSMGDTVKIIAEIMDANIEIECDAQRVRPKKNEVERLWADKSNAGKITGWTPAYKGSMV